MTINKNQITAVILAGGKGSRLGGQDKGLVDYQNKPLIEHVLEKIEPQVGQIIINANRNQDEYAKFKHPVISDELSDFQGPLAGFLTGMKTCNTDYILTLPCDGPDLPDDLVSRLISEVQNNNIVVAHDGKRLQPVHALIPTSLIESLEGFLANGDRKIDLWYAQHPMATADFSDKPEVFFNVNTEEQRQQQHQQQQGKPQNG
ncbi:molybdenum cofactor guanylyltransferase MobA [Cocleimonas sp. KMM 6892]|uniref:molybdenum cofactor guanylyltransferase MobA n=1 Tax=unclassified Cocleimonas TaxID=2639732 RepID=UPI002DB9EC89|nr:MULTISPECIES: molybdenum cofactor guanylyltransferase MobA [unclassified Cocleimonas]MEB8434178.1 molybdenum cofactor guanylyltransferase MobA [Cocleimonas sp. KMM 6892]MEC4716962.1 molybdenum cofactor guanylyltransferase MobA [Cocleimonas sp. KMM 6895]MEC4746450.1 molybdenum cofactor guanylyltransferase MobA [Cocleimonas sp. KMM 6896]